MSKRAVSTPASRFKCLPAVAPGADGKADGRNMSFVEQYHGDLVGASANAAAAPSYQYYDDDRHRQHERVTKRDIH